MFLKLFIQKIFDYAKPTDSNKSVKSIVQYYDNGKKKNEGDFFDNNYNGLGFYYYPNGDADNGEWKNGKRHGEGVYYNDKDLFIDGFWENDNKIVNNNMKEKNVLINKANKINPKKEKIKREESIIR
jgi:antitoxin component YwqK of YwqJK toxin-antitoxin module